MSAPELSPEEQRIVARFDAAPTTVEHMTGVLLTAILGDTDGGLVLEGDLPANEVARLIAEVAADAALAVFRGQQDPAVQRVLALAEERDRHHAAYCCTVDCPDGGEHIDPTDPIHIDELLGAWSENPPPMRDHRTIPCPKTCTCPTGPDVAAIRAAIGGDGR